MAARKGASASGAPAPVKAPKTVKRYVAKCDVPVLNEGATVAYEGRTTFGPCPWNGRPDPVLHDTPGKAWREATIHGRDAGHLHVEEHEYVVERKVSVKLTLLEGGKSA